MAIPLPALAVQPPRAPDLLGEFQRMMALKSMVQQQQADSMVLQESQLQLADDQKSREAVAQSGGDLSKLQTNLIKSGVGPQTLMNVMTHLTNWQNSQATLTQTQLQNYKAQSDIMGGQLQGLANISDASKRQVAYSEWLKTPQTQQFLQLHNITLPDLVPSQQDLQMYAGLTQLGSTLTKNAIDEKVAEAKQSEAATSATKFKAQLPGIQAASAIQQQEANLNPQQRAQLGNVYVGAASGNEADQGAVNLETRQKVKASEAEGRAKVALMQAAATQGNAALAGVPSKLVNQAAAGYSKLSGAYQNAMEAANNLGSMIQLAQTGNKVSGGYLPTSAAEFMNALNSIHRVNTPEIRSMSGTGSLIDRLNGFAGKWTAGQPVPQNILKDMRTLEMTIAANAQNQFLSGVKNHDAAYGSHFMPLAQNLVGNRSVRGTNPTPLSPPTPGTHVFNVQAWLKANPGGDAAAATAQAQREGYTVLQ